MKPLPRVPLAEAWEAVRSVDWNDPTFDLRKAFLCAVFSELIYRHIPGWEVGDQSRMWMVPCDAYRQIAAKLARSDFNEVLAQSDIFEPTIFSTENIVGSMVSSRGIIIIALRGTAKFYDWLLDADIRRDRWPDPASDLRFHAGFFREA